MNSTRIVTWGHWGQRGCPGAERAAAVPHEFMVLGTLWACWQFVPSAPKPNMQRGQTQASPLLVCPTVPTSITTICKKACRYQRAKNDLKSWS